MNKFYVDLQKRVKQGLKKNKGSIEDNERNRPELHSFVNLMEYILNA